MRTINGNNGVRVVIQIPYKLLQAIEATDAAFQAARGALVAFRLVSCEP